MFLIELSATLFVVFALQGVFATSGTNMTDVQWTDCDPSVVPDPAISCGFLDVPLDYHNASAGNGRIVLAKSPATAQPRLGTVFFNPGGPGASGAQALGLLSAQLLAFTGGQYDVVSWDPRGVGSSIPGDIQCFSTLDEYNALFSGTIQLTGIEMTGNFTDPADLAALFAEAGVLQEKYVEAARRCIERNGEMLRYIGTAATARDMVALSDALEGPGEAVNYYGVSYGSFLGQVFVNMFPDRVGRVVIDGIVDPFVALLEPISLNWKQFYVDSDAVYKAFVTGCALSGPAGCSISTHVGQSPAEVDAAIQAVLKTAHDTARENPNDSVSLTSGMIRTNELAVLMYVPALWANFSAQTWPQIAQTVASESAVVGKLQTNNDSAPSAVLPGPSFAQTAITCGENVNPDPSTTMKDVFDGIVDAAQYISHMFGASFPVPAYMCSFWSPRAVERYSGPLNHTLANPILVLGNTFDPATPFAAAKRVADLFGDQAALVRLNGFGHSTIAEPSACIIALAQAYFSNGTLPEGHDTVCEVDADFEPFPGVNTQDILAALSDTTL